jgi:hypothetical protein
LSSSSSPAARRRKRTHADLSKELFMSASQGFRSLDRAEAARLLNPPSAPAPPGSGEQLLRLGMWPNNQNLKEFLTCDAKYVFSASARRRNSRHSCRGSSFPAQTALSPGFSPAAGLALRGRSVRGIEFSPLYKHAPQSAC